MVRADVFGGVALSFFLFCFLTGNDDVLRGRPTRATRAARADVDDTHSDSGFTVPSTARAHDSLEVFIRTASSGQTASHPVNAIIAEHSVVSAPDLTDDPVAAAVNSLLESQALFPHQSRGPPFA